MLAGSSLARLFLACCLSVFLFASIHSVAAFALNGYRWPAGSQITLHLQLDRPMVPLQDGFSSWNASAADALAIWNQHLDHASFVEGPALEPAGGDGANSASFSHTIYGETFPPGVLAVTLTYSPSGNLFRETDVIFNNSIKWNSYRGPIQGSGPTATYDLHRVALHEFGHALGLDHPDQHGQNVAAIMNSVISHLDHVTDDDIAGAESLYGVRITSGLNPLTIYMGEPFHYQIMANNGPVSYEAIGLPAGLSIDPGSGTISGAPTVAGTFQVTLIAHAPGKKDASATLSITVKASRITSNLHPPYAHVGDAFSYQITATNNPFEFDAVGLPNGLSLNRATGLISGSPTANGTFQVTLIARTAAGEGTAILTIVVVPFDVTSSRTQYVSLGAGFQYQITANNNPTSFDAIGLPPGLEIDRATGRLSGAASLSGSYVFTVIAHSARGDAIGTVQLFVSPMPPLQPRPAGVVKVFDIPAQHLAFDPSRSRVYASDRQSSTIAVIDAVTLTPVRVINLPHQPHGLAISADHQTLWAACDDYGVYGHGWIVAIDLDTLEVAKILNLPGPANSVAEGPGGRLYTSAGNSSTYEVDQNTGALLGTIYHDRGMVVANREQGVLFLASVFSPATILALEISQPQARVREQTDWNTRGGSGRDLKLSHNGAYLTFAGSNGNELVPEVTATALMSTSDVRVVLGNFVHNSSDSSVLVGPMAFSNDDKVFYQAASLGFLNDGIGTSQLQIFDVASFAQTGVIDLGHLSTVDAPVVKDMVVDGSDGYIFVATEGYGFAGQLRVYHTGRGTPPAALQVPDHSVLNVSTRLRVAAGENVAIGGFIITGDVPKKVMVRAMGPSLAKFGVQGALGDPVLELRNAAGQLVGENNNWNSRRTDVLVTGFAPSDEHEAALMVTLQPGAYTAIVRGVGGNAGVALVEMYDMSPGGSKLANISTRGKIETGENVMIGGFIVGGSQQTSVAVRAIGPSLEGYGIAGTLRDPMLEVRDGNGALLAHDDDWRDFQEQPLIDSGLAPGENRESAMLLYLQPGAYTAVVRGKDNSTGVGLVEVYNLNAQ